MVFKCGTLIIWENKGWIQFINPYGWFWWCFRYQLDNKKQIARWNGIVSRFKGKLK